MNSSTPYQSISLRKLLSRFRWRIVITMLLVVIEAILGILFPLFIGFSINGLLEQSTTELINLGILGGLALFIGGARRFYDTLVYSGIYTIIATEMVERDHAKEKPISAIAARATLLTEFVEFLENSVPMIVENLFGIVGVLLIVFSLHTSVFVACLALFIWIIMIYVLTGRLNFRLNRNYNDELEKQVDVLSTQESSLIKNHFRMVMKWNIRLSGLETVNYIGMWIGIIALLVYSPLVVIGSGVSDFGLVFSILMYVFQYIRSIVNLPLFIQQIIRLQEISQRLQE